MFWDQYRSQRWQKHQSSKLTTIISRNTKDQMQVSSIATSCAIELCQKEKEKTFQKDSQENHQKDFAAW